MLKRITTQTLLGTVSAAPTESLVGQRVGNYDVVALVGSGGAGSVYRAEHPVIGTTVAIKVLRPGLASIPGIVERFVQEVRAANEIGSPQIPRYFDFGALPDGRPFAVMEFLDGEGLNEVLRRHGRIEAAEAGRLLSQVARAMQAAHEAGIVHRDLKPENIFLVGDGEHKQVKVLDFGVAKLMSPSSAPSLTQNGLVFGTPLYSAPEQLLGEEIGPAADVYALGVTAFELLTGQPPFIGEGTDVVTKKITTEAPSLLELREDVSIVVADAVARMLARRVADRPASMAEVASMFDAWAAPPPVVAAEPVARAEANAPTTTMAAAPVAAPVPEEEPAAPVRHRRTGLVVGVMGAVAVVVVLVLMRALGHAPPVAATAPATPPASATPAPEPVAVPPPAALPAPATAVEAKAAEPAALEPAEAHASKPAPAKKPKHSKPADVIVADPFQ